MRERNKEKTKQEKKERSEGKLRKGDKAEVKEMLKGTIQLEIKKCK